MAQSLSQLWVHIIFSTKNRYPLLEDINIQKRMHEYIAGICFNLNCIPDTIGGVADHVHLLVVLSKTITLSDFIEEIKKSSSMWIKQLPEKNTSIEKFYWQRGYGAFSVSQSNISHVRRYIQNQHDHHKTITFEDELRKFLTRHKMVFDEKYLWN